MGEFENWAEEETAEAKLIQKLEREVLARKAETSKLKRRIKVAEEDRREAEEKYAEVLELVERPVEPLKVSPRTEKDKPPACPVVLASDWHVDERVDPRTVRGKNEYNPEIASERAEKFFQRVLRLVGLHRRYAEINELIMWCGGDFITGHIHPEGVQDNSMAPLEAKGFVMDLLIGGFDFLLKRGDFERILVPCNYGNHGRTTKETRYSTGAVTNHEWEMYHLLARHYRDEPRIEFQITRGPDLTFEVYGFVVRGSHGDGVSYRGGIGSLSIPLNLRILRSLRMDPVAFDVLGHWHVWQTDGRTWMVNGSLRGVNAYTLGKWIEPDEPQQGFFLVDQGRRRVTAMCPIWVT
jgi:hypothetical protein